MVASSVPACVWMCAPSRSSRPAGFGDTEVRRTCRRLEGSIVSAAIPIAADHETVPRRRVHAPLPLTARPNVMGQARPGCHCAFTGPRTPSEPPQASQRTLAARSASVTPGGSPWSLSRPQRARRPQPAQVSANPQPSCRQSPMVVSLDWPPTRMGAPRNGRQPSSDLSLTCPSSQGCNLPVGRSLPRCN